MQSTIAPFRNQQSCRGLHAMQADDHANLEDNTAVAIASAASDAWQPTGWQDSQCARVIRAALPCTCRPLIEGMLLP
jgi:hypothetical protein